MVLWRYQVFVVLAVFLFGLHAGLRSAAGEEASTDQASPQVTLEIGDQAPGLEVDHWLGGEQVGAFERGTVYVVEFWATWCAPCIKSMPHLSELAERYSEDGLVVVAVTTADEANTQEAVEKFIAGPGKEYRFRYAFCEGDSTYKSYMEATGQNGIPCSFVIDQEGKLAFVGRPHDLDYVLERVTTGKWRGKADIDEIQEMNNSIAKLGEMAQSDPDKALQIVEHIRRVNPKRAASLDFSYVEVLVFCRKGMFDRAKEAIESHCQGPEGSVDWGAVAMLSGAFASKELNPDGKHLEFALAKIGAAEESLKDDWQNLVQVGLAYQFTGNTEKYKACMDRVIELCPDENMKNSLRMAMEMHQKAGGK